MASLEQRLAAFVAAVGADIKALQAGGGGGGGTGVKTSALLPANTPLDGTELVPVVQNGVNRQVTRADLVRTDVQKCMTAAQANTTVTPAPAFQLSTALDVGTWLVKVWVCYRAAAATTGIEMFLRHNGTTTRLVSTWYTLSGSGITTGIANGNADQATTATAQVIEGKGQRASNVASGTTQGVDTPNADQFAVVEGIVVVTAIGALDLMFRSEVATSAVTLMEGTTLEARKVA